MAQVVPFIHWHNVKRRGRAQLLEPAAAGGIHYLRTVVLQRVLQRQLKGTLQTELHERGSSMIATARFCRWRHDMWPTRLNSLQLGRDTMPIRGKFVTAEQTRVFLPGTRVANRHDRIGTVIVPSQEMLEQCTSDKFIPVQWDDVGVNWMDRKALRCI